MLDALSAPMERAVPVSLCCRSLCNPPRLNGLRSWLAAAEATRLAGIATQTGTLCVERPAARQQLVLAAVAPDLIEGLVRRGVGLSFV